MEVVIVADAEAAAAVVAGDRRAAARRPPGAGARPGHRAVRRSPPTGCLSRPSTPAGSRSPHADAVLLDEYVGLPPDHPQAYRTFIRHEHLVDHVDLEPTAAARTRRATPTTCRRGVRALRGAARRARRRRPAAARHRQRRAHRVQRAGLVAVVADADQDADRADPRRQRPLLRPSRRRAAPRRHAGPGTILEARHLVLVACGAAKAATDRGAVEGPLTAMCPASVLQLHPHATVVVDEAARVRLAHSRVLPRDVRGKPAWQPL